MRRWTALSLTYKLTLITIGVGLLGVCVIALFAQQATQREFGRFIINQERQTFLHEVTLYYEAHGTWVGVLERLPPLPLMGRPPNRPPNNAPPRNDDNAPPATFMLVDQNGCAVTPARPYKVGDCVDPGMVAGGQPVLAHNVKVGTVLTVNPVPNLGGIERAFLNAMNGALRNAALVATGLALVLGLVLTRMVTRPLKALTTAIHAMSDGSLKQEVAVTTQDEFGEVAMAFNQMSEKLSQANQLRRQMTADIAHELRNPLVVITGYIESMRDGVLKPTPDRLAVLYEEGQHLQHLVDDLWTLARADAGELPLSRRTIAVPELLQRTAGAYGDRARLRNITLTVAENIAPNQVAVDPERIAQVLGNLVSNALRYTAEGGEIHLAAQAEEASVHVTVADNGSGIAPDDLPFVFERFYRSDPARATNNGESGLGLAIVKSIVAAHGGDIAVTSRLGVGTTFTITLPVADGNTP